VLTGANFDLESFRQIADVSFWFGDEFGPYLLHTDVVGKPIDPPITTPYPSVLAPFARNLAYVQSTDNPTFIDLPNTEVRCRAPDCPFRVAKWHQAHRRRATCERASPASAHRRGSAISTCNQSITHVIVIVLPPARCRTAIS